MIFLIEAKRARGGFRSAADAPFGKSVECPEIEFKSYRSPILTCSTVPESSVCFEAISVMNFSLEAKRVRGSHGSHKMDYAAIHGILEIQF